MFAVVSAFPKSLHCTDEAQQAETVLSAVVSILVYIYIYIYIYIYLDSLLDLKCFQLFELFAVLLSTLGRVRHNAASFGKPRVSLRSLGMVL